jgi:transcriptional regulator of acetoin/glycerol metabolism
MAKNHRLPFNVWMEHVRVLRCQSALIFTRGNQRQAARLIGLDRTTFNKILRRNNARLEALARAEGWKCP